MVNIIIRPDWHLPARLVVPEAVFLNRRAFLREMGFAGLGLLGAPLVSSALATAAETPNSAPSTGTPPLNKYPAPRNQEFNPNWTLTNEKVAGRYNNFYEFSLGKDVYRYVDQFVTTPWPI